MLRSLLHVHEQEGPAEPLREYHLRHWRAALADRIVRRFPGSIGQGIEDLNTLIAEEDCKAAARCSAEWRRKFYDESPFGAVRAVLKPAEVPFGGAGNMREQWVKVWRRPAVESARCAAAWEAWAARVGLPQQQQRQWQPPTLEAFMGALLHSCGGAGADGWSSDEIRWLAGNFPWLFEAMYEMLLLSVTDNDHHGVVRDLALWRVVGIPKRTGGFRPIAVGAVVLRVWQRLLLAALPEPSPRQHCGKPGSSAVTATASWLTAGGKGGIEYDLETAYDRIFHSVATVALRWCGTPECIIQHLLRVWGGGRICMVSGATAQCIACCNSGLPPGEPTAGRALDVVMQLWPAILRHALCEVNTWMFSDDRALRVLPSVPDERIDAVLDMAADLTHEFDCSIGVKENVGKRQRWRAPAVVEHLGLLVSLDAQGMPVTIVPRDGWPQQAADQVRTLPGTVALRRQVVVSMILPKYLWAAPLVQPPPADAERGIFRSVVRSSVTWWCRHRWAASHFQLHPTLSWAVRTLKGAPAHWDMPFVQQLAEQAAEILTLRIVRRAEVGLLVQCAGAALASVQATIRGQPGGGDTFDTGTERGMHFVRIAARGAALLKINPTRHDAGGHELIDIEVSTSRQWRAYVESLPFAQRGVVEIVRGGAAWSPTRRHLKRKFFVNGHPPSLEEEVAHGLLANPEYLQMRELCSCKRCGEHWCSLGHVVRHCPALDSWRLRLSSRPIAWWGELTEVTAKSLWAVQGMQIGDLIAVAKLLLAADPWRLEAGIGADGFVR
jgi:hypothetical protein